jgi:anti-sigma B factor antagonist
VRRFEFHATGRWEKGAEAISEQPTQHPRSGRQAVTGGGRIEAPAVDGGSPVLVITGEHDLSTAPELRAQLHELGETSPIIIDLDETTFVDSSILGVLVGGLRRARERDVPFGLVLGDQAHPAIRRIFELTGLHEVFPIFASRAEAQAGLGGGAPS